MLVIGAENDIGFALLIFILFIGLLWIATGRFAYLVLGLALFGVGAYLAATSSPVPRAGLHLARPWTQAQTAGYQLVQGWYALGSGGVGGVGLGHGIAGRSCRGHLDMIFASIGRSSACSAPAWLRSASCCSSAQGSTSPKRPARTSPS